MRTLYFLEQGQKLNDIKPSERRRALLVSKEEWRKFGDHLVRKRKEAEAIEREKEEMEQRKYKSKEMAKTWDGTVMNIRQKRIEARRLQKADIENNRRKCFLEMRKEEADNKKEIIKEAQRILRLNKSNNVCLMSALRSSEVLREREEQIKFAKTLKNISDAKEKAYAEKLKADAENCKLELEKEREKEILKKKRLNKQLRKQMEELLREKEKEEQEKLLEAQENMRIEEEIRSAQENQRKEKERKKQLVMDDVLENRRLVEEYQDQCKREQEDEESAMQIHAATKKRIAIIKKQKEREEATKKQIQRENIAEAVAAKAADKESEENRIIQKAVAEREARDDELREKKTQYRHQLVAELKEERIHQLQAEEVEKLKEKELLKINTMQRLKNTEFNKEFTRMMDEKKRQEQLNNRTIWAQQHEEKVAAKAAEKLEDINAVARSVECWNLEDKIFLKYAKSVVEESQEKARPLIPILRYIEQFKKEVGITVRKQQHKIWQSRVPINNKLFECPPERKQVQDYWPSHNDIQNAKQG